MADNSEKIARFEQTVKAQSDSEINAILSEAEKKAADIINKANDDCINSSYETIQKKSKEIRRNYKKKVSQASFMASREIFAYRNKLIEDFFEELHDKLAEFAKTDKYREYLGQLAEEANADKALDSDVTAYVRPEDCNFAAVLFSKIYPQVKVEADRKIELGGITFYYHNDSTYADKTLDIAFAAEKEEFVNNSEMQLKKLTD